MSNKIICPIFIALNTKFSKRILQIVILKKSGAIDEVKIVFSNNSLQINLRAIYQIK